MLAILVLLTYLFTRVEKNSVEKTEVRSFNTLEKISIRTSLESYERNEGEIIGPLKYLKTSLDIEKVWQAPESCDTKIPNEFEDPVTYDYKVLIVPRTILHIPLAHIEFRCGGTSYEVLW